MARALGAIAACVSLLGCGRLGFDHDATAPDASVVVDRCPAAPIPDVTSPDRVVGTGTPASCNEAALRAAVTAGGVIAFDCGAVGHTFPLTAELVVTSTTVLAGGGSITLDGTTTTRILHVPAPGAALTLLGLTLENGASTASGAGVLIERGALTVIDTTFLTNRGPASATDGSGGGAIAALPGATLAIYGSTFTENQSNSGGAIQAASDLVLVNSALRMNIATGVGGMVGQGLGGAINSVGVADNVFCGVTLEGNSATATGGAYSRISTTGAGSDRIERTSLVDNHTATGGGGAYIQDIAVTLRQVVIANNGAQTAGGLWYVGAGPLDVETATIAGNSATLGLGAGLRASGTPGTIAFSTILGNRGTCSDCYAAAIDGGQNLTLRASVIAYNMIGGSFVPVSCTTPLLDGGANLQWPVLRNGGGTDDPGSLCSASATVIDPRMNPLAARAGPAGTFLVATPAASSAALAIVGDCPIEDQLGNPRPVPCAAGAVEP